jgi:hypothetical protein
MVSPGRSLNTSRCLSCQVKNPPLFEEAGVLSPSGESHDALSPFEGGAGGGQ